MAFGRPGSLWQRPGFRRLWGANAVSALGSQVTLVALPLTAIVVIHARAAEVALLATAATLPNFVLGLPLGVVVDRLPRRRVMVAADLASAVAIGSVPVAAELGALSLVQLYGVAFLGGTLALVHALASQAYLPHAVEKARLVEANAKFEGARIAASAAGPSAAGALVSVATAPIALAADAASFLASACLLGSIGDRDATVRAADAETSAWRDLGEGGRYVVRDRYLRPLLVANCLANLMLGAVWATVLVYAVRSLAVQPAAVALVLSIGQAGGLVGVAVGRRANDAVGVGRVALMAFFLFGPATVVLATAPRAHAVVWLAAGWVLESLARALYSVSAISISQAVVPLALQARVAGFFATAGTGAFPLGTLLGGALAAAAGVRAAMLVAAALSFLPSLPIAASPVRSLRRLADATSESTA